MPSVTRNLKWESVYAAVTEATPPPRPVSSDDVLKEELGPMYVMVPGSFERYFGEVLDLTHAVHAVFRKCKEGIAPLCQEESGWQDYIGSQCHWSRILVHGELKSNPIASKQFNISQDGLQFRYMEIERNNCTERLVIRATTCWKVHLEDEWNTQLVVKDSWQYPEREEEGKLLRWATGKHVINVARYFHHGTVRTSGRDDDMRTVRGGLDITKAENYVPRKPTPSRTGRRKRSSSCTNVSMPPSKRTCSSSLTKPATANCIHRRVIERDDGEPIYKVSLEYILLADNSSWTAFLINLDLANQEGRVEASGARGKTGTRVSMAIRVLLDDEQHSFMHDLGSFFWVLSWVCIHYDGQQERVVKWLDKWNYLDADELAGSKRGVVDDEQDFLKTARRLHRKVFSSGESWRVPSRQMYFDMREILRAARKELNESEERDQSLA
ncbi:hypothetical protein EJ07DRAFT_168594 [Lizonia empirigonia]|nr:hypothetical protein EJ07DRAFT_168594 [Lizonia empirigonia]